MSATTEDQTHNGWKNYSTWVVNLWLSNDEPLYLEALERTREVLRYGNEYSQVVDGIWTVEEACRYTTADMLKNWVTYELAPDLGASFAADLLGYALSEVDWAEIADAWIEMADDH